MRSTISRRTLLVISAACASATLASACARVAVDPIEVRPIHIVHDVNIRVDRELEDFFAFEREMREARAATQAAATQPAATQPVTAEPADVVAPMTTPPVPTEAPVDVH